MAERSLWEAEGAVEHASGLVLAEEVPTPLAAV